MIYKAIIIIIFSFYVGLTKAPISSKPKSAEVVLTVNNSIEANVESIYNNLTTNSFSLPKKESFTKAMLGYVDLKQKGIIQKEILTIVDYSLSSKENRLWIIDLENNSILLQSFVAHGRNSGNEFAENFSNIPQSYKSSLGFYVTGETYFGKHGYSLRLDGMEEGVNNNARERAIVVHGADYVSESFIQQYGRLGRSLGCLALSQKLSKEVINIIKNNTCIYVYYPS